MIYFNKFNFFKLNYLFSYKNCIASILNIDLFIYFNTTHELNHNFQKNLF
jgi:hypothetical protein